MNMVRKVIAITGANRGLGFGTIEYLLRNLPTDSYRIVLCSRDMQKGNAAYNKIKQNFPQNCKYVDLAVLDIGNENSRATFQEFVKEEYGQLDSLINNAGVNHKESAENPLTEEGLKEMLNTNFLGIVSLTEDLIRRDLFNVDSGLILNLCSRLANPKALRHPSLLPLSKKPSPPYPVSSLVDFAGLYKDLELERGCKASKGLLADSVPYPSYIFTKLLLSHYTSLLSSRGLFAMGVCPGWVRTDMGGMQAPKTLEDGAAEIGVRVAEWVFGGREGAEGNRGGMVVGEDGKVLRGR